MPESLDDWREFFRRTNADVFELIDNAIVVAALDCPDGFRSQRGRFMERLYSCKAGRHTAGDQVGSCDTASKESMASSDGRGDDEQCVVDMDEESCGSFREAEAFTGEIDEQPRVVREVMRIKQVLDNSGLESASVLCESLRSLQSMAITLDILKTTRIGISVDSLRRNCGSKKIARLAHSIAGRWKAMVDAHGSADPCNGDPETEAAARVVKSNSSSQTTPSNKIAAEKFDKERKVRLEKPKEAAVRDRQLTSQKGVSSNGSLSFGLSSQREANDGYMSTQFTQELKYLQEVATHIKLEAAKRRIQERYQREANN